VTCNFCFRATAEHRVCQSASQRSRCGSKREDNLCKTLLSQGGQHPAYLPLYLKPYALRTDNRYIYMISPLLPSISIRSTALAIKVRGGNQSKSNHGFLSAMARLRICIRGSTRISEHTNDVALTYPLYTDAHPKSSPAVKDCMSTHLFLHRRMHRHQIASFPPTIRQWPSTPRPSPLCDARRGFSASHGFCRGPNDLSYLVARQQGRCKGIQAHVGITCYTTRLTFQYLSGRPRVASPRVVLHSR
jgi:hypothetical protein